MNTQLAFDTALRIYHDNKVAFLRFLTVGIGTTAIYIGLFLFCSYVLHAANIISVSTAFISSATYQFFVNRKVTFNVNSPQLTLQIMKYVVLLLINYVLSILILELFVWSMSAPIIGIFVTALVTPITGYLLFKHWVFRNQIPIFNLEK